MMKNKINFMWLFLNTLLVSNALFVTVLLADEEEASRQSHLKKAELVDVNRFKKSMKENDPTSDQSANKLADLLINAGYNVQALAELEKYIVKNDSLNFEIRLRVAQMYRDALDYSKTMEHVAILEKMRPRSSEVALLKGSSQVAMGLYSEAVKTLSNDGIGIEISSEMEGYKSFALNGLKKYKEALDLTRAILVVNKLNPLALLGQAEAYIGLGKKDEALSSLNLLIKNKTLTPFLLVKAGKLYRDAGDIRASKDFYARAYEIQPDRAETAIELGKAYFDLEDYAPAKHVLETMIKKQPDNDRVVYYLAKTYSQIGEIDLAGKIVGKYWETYPTQAWAAAAYGRALSLSGNSERAIEVLKKTMSLENGDYSEAIVTSGEILLGEEKFKEALDVLHKGEVKFKKDPSIKNELGKVYLALGDTEKATYWETAAKKTDRESRIPASSDSITGFREKVLK